MNPKTISIGVGVIFLAATIIYNLWKGRKNQHSSNEMRHNEILVNSNYDGSNISSCCICLTEFKYLERNEVINLPCKHKICKKCGMKMFAHQVINKRNCPQCRQLVSEEFISHII